MIIICLFANCSGSGSKEDKEEKGKTTIQLPPDQFKSKLSSTPGAVLVDVRKPEEVAEGMIDGAINIDYSAPTFDAEIQKLDKTSTYFLYCKSGKRSSDAARKMEDEGFENIYVLEGGYSNLEQ